MKIHRIGACVLMSCSAAAFGAPPAESLPIREVTVFKDGHAMVLRSGSVVTNPDGDVVLDELPKPVLGTFWAFEDEAKAELRSVRASRQDVERLRQPETIRELIEANVGRKILWKVSDTETKVATILDLLVSEPAPAPPPPPINRGVVYAQPIPFASPSPVVKTVLLRFEDGSTLAQPIEQMRTVTFVQTPNTDAVINDRVEAERLTVDLEWEGAPDSNADIGLMYVQRGLRWIPGYRVTMLDGGRARVELQATLINELDDLNDVSCNLVIGVPRFEFEHTMDPMALSNVMASLGPYFQQASGTGRGLSNALMAQTARSGESFASTGSASQSAPEVSGSERAEDLYIFAIDHVTLRRGERMVIPIHAFETSFESVYKLDLPIEPPMGARRNFSSNQQRKLAELMSRPRAMHMLRLTNQSEHPITTAPALIVQENGMPLAQGMLTYTSSGAKVDLEVTAAVDIQVEVDSEETGDRAESRMLGRLNFVRIDLRNTCVITNRKAGDVLVEVRAYALGRVDRVNEKGESTAVNIYSESALYATQIDAYAWWRSWSWPWWWTQLNGATRIEWTLELEPGETLELEWLHHYFWKL